MYLPVLPENIFKNTYAVNRRIDYPYKFCPNNSLVHGLKIGIPLLPKRISVLEKFVLFGKILRTGTNLM